MLAQNFRSSDDLGITKAQHDALRKTLVLLETGKLTHVEPGFKRADRGSFTGHFNMNEWNSASDCGTVCCLGGTAELIGNVKFEPSRLPEGLDELFFPNISRIQDLTTTHAATALRSYLTNGDAKWHEACGFEA
jgi:hypothetical protein